MSSFKRFVFNLIKRTKQKKRVDFCKRLLTSKGMDLNDISDVTILSSDCTAGIIYHDFGLQFKTPTINIHFEPLDFCLFCKRLALYLNCDLKEDFSDEKTCPVGILDPLGTPPPSNCFFGMIQISRMQKINGIGAFTESTLIKSEL